MVLLIPQYHSCRRAQVSESQRPCSLLWEATKKREEGTEDGNKILVTIDQADRVLSAREGMADQRVSLSGKRTPPRARM